MKRIQEKDLSKLSTITGIPLESLSKLHAMGLFDESKIIDILIKDDYKRIRTGGKYSVRVITSALMHEYQVSKGKVQSAIYHKRKREFICSQCGKTIKKAEFQRNEGLCDACVINNIKL